VKQEDPVDQKNEGAVKANVPLTVKTILSPQDPEDDDDDSSSSSDDDDDDNKDNDDDKVPASTPKAHASDPQDPDDDDDDSDDDDSDDDSGSSSDDDDDTKDPPALDPQDQEDDVADSRESSKDAVDNGQASSPAASSAEASADGDTGVVDGDDEEKTPWDMLPEDIDILAIADVPGIMEGDNIGHDTVGNAGNAALALAAKPTPGVPAAAKVPTKNTGKRSFNIPLQSGEA
jgi:hypothetical protein